MAPETKLRNMLLNLMEEEFAPEGISVRDDKLLDASGEGEAVAGAYPDYSEPWARDAQVQHTVVVVQMHNAYNTDWINTPDERVSPATIESWADRLRRKIKSIDGIPSSANPDGWFFLVERTLYPDDPTGNKTRLNMIVRGYSMNAALAETTP